MDTSAALRLILEHHNIPVDFVTEAQLLDWQKSSCRDGPKIKFLLQDDDDVAPFEMATVAKGKVAGQLYILIGIRNDNTVQAKAAEATGEAASGVVGGALAKLAGQWCRDPHFHSWVAKRLNATEVTEEQVIAFVRETCGIASRAELDSNENAKAAFMEFIRMPYMNWKGK